MLRKIATMRKQHSAAFKAQIVVETLRETKTLAQIAAEHEIHPTLVTKWRTEALSMLPELFERGAKRETTTLLLEHKVEQLYQEIGRLTLQVNWMKKKSGLDPDTF